MRGQFPSIFQTRRSPRTLSVAVCFRRVEVPGLHRTMPGASAAASSAGAPSLSQANERLPENELQMAAITFMQHAKTT